MARIELLYRFDGNPHEYVVSTDDVIEFLEDTYNAKAIQGFLNKIKDNAYIDEYFLKNPIKAGNDFRDACELLARNIFHLRKDALWQNLKSYFEDDAKADYEQNVQEDTDIDECITEAFETDDEPDTEKEHDYKAEYIEKYGDTVIYANGQIECKILDVDYDDEFGYDIKIENPLYVDEMDDDFKEIWIGDPNAPIISDEDEDAKLLPSIAVKKNAEIEAEEESEQSNEESDYDETDDDFLNGNW